MDINPGIESSNPTYLVQHQLSNTLFFSAVKPPYGRELYSFTLNDALEQDRPPYTRHEHQTSLSPRNGSLDLNLIEDIHIGHGGSDPKYITLRDTTAASPSIYFSATDGVRGRELWISDGQPMVSGDGSGSGTHIVKDIYPGDASSGKYIYKKWKRERAFAYMEKH